MATYTNLGMLENLAFNSAIGWLWLPLWWRQWLITLHLLSFGPILVPYAEVKWYFLKNSIRVLEYMWGEQLFTDFNCLS